MLHVRHRPNPIDAFEEHRVLLAVLHYFSEHFHETIMIPELSRQLGISLVHIETAFDLLKGITASQALLEYRLNRLCDLMHREPTADISSQISRCGLSSEETCGLADFQRTDQQFIACFGIDLIAYHQQCFLAQAVRLQCDRNQESSQSELVLGQFSSENRLLSRFHQLA